MTARVWALEDEELEGARLLTLLSLADYANGEDQCWASVPTIAKKTRVSDRQVQRSIQWLESRGYIQITEKGNGRGRLTTYQLLLKGDISDKKGDISNTMGDTMTPIGETLSTVDSIKGDISDIKGDIGDEIQSHARREPIQQPTTKREKEIAADAAAPTLPVEEKPTSKRSRKSQTPPNTSGAPPQTEPSEWQEFVGAMCWLCHAHKEVKSLTKEQRGALLSEAKEIHELGFTTKDLKKWYQTVWSQSWQRQKNKTSRPNPADVRSSIAQLRAETPEGFEDPIAVRVHVNGTSKVAASLAALADYEEIKASHGVTT